MKAPGKPVTPKAIAQSLTELWSPRVIGELDDCYIKVAKVHGSFGWHAHEHEDELFFVLSGELLIELESGPITLSPGELFVVPKGIRHNPVAADECLIMLIERKTTQHSGNEKTPWTRSLSEQLGALP